MVSVLVGVALRHFGIGLQERTSAADALRHIEVVAGLKRFNTAVESLPVYVRTCLHLRNVLLLFEVL